jgi:hypothetical protein
MGIGAGTGAGGAGMRFAGRIKRPAMLRRLQAFVE